MTVAPAPSASAQAAPPSPPRPPGGLITTALRPAVAIGIQPVRASVDSLRVTLDYVLHIGNTGQAPALGVSVETWLFGAGSNPQAELDQLFAQPPGQLQLPPFDLMASAQGDLAGQSIAPREALATINAGERRMFVPMLAVRALYTDRRGKQQGIVAAFLVGAERDGQDRLAPLALDRGSRAYERLAARPFER